MSAVLKPGTASTVSGDADVKTDETIDGFQLVIDALKLNGIDTIFGLPGSRSPTYAQVQRADCA